MKERKVTAYITDALFELLRTKDLTNITTTEIIQKAGVCRSSFYRNFYLPEDIIRRYSAAMFEQINEKMPITHEGLRQRIEAVNIYLWSQRERLTLIEKRGLFYLLEGAIMDHCKRQMQRLGLQSHRYMADISAGATTQLIRAWVRNGFEESPQEIAALVCELVKWDGIKSMMAP